ncbi:MAG: T9SS type A sorting domain-containing protein [Chlorobi bacterium]|nr:T9SS type A sorting domain-containing protein [Chlorobiota bacterium]
MIRIKRIFPLLVLLITGTAANSQDFVYDWVRSAGGERWDLANAVVIDTEKNVYMAGGFEQTAFFGNDSIVSSGDRDIFIAKYDSLGTLIWLKSAGGKKYDNVIDMKIDNENNLLVTGNFQDTSYFDNSKLITDGYMNIFIAKYSSDGNVLQIKKINAETKAKKLVLTPAGNTDFFLSGTYYNQMNIDSDTIQSTGGTNIFVARFKNDFTSKSLINIEGYSDISLKDIKYFEHEIYLLCDFTDSIDINGSIYRAYGSSDILMLKIDSTDNIKNEKHIAGFGPDEACSLIIDKDSSIYLSSEFESVLYFDEDSLISEGGKDLLLMKTDNNFNTLWYKQIGSNTNEYSNSLLVNSVGTVYLTGSFSDNLTIKNKTITSKDMTADMFIAEFTPTGNNIGLKQAGGSGNEYNNIVINDPDNYLYIIGDFAYNFAFETDSISSDSIFSANNDDIFIARFYDCTYANFPDIGNDTSFCGYGSLHVRNDIKNPEVIFGHYNKYLWNTGHQGKYITIYDSGYYSVTTTDSHKCRVTSNSIFVAVNPVPEPDLGNDIYATPEEIIELNGGNFKTYHWNNDSTTQSLNVNTFDLHNFVTNFSLTVTNSFGCMGEDDINIFVQRANSSPKLSKITKKIISRSSLVYPNPNNGHFFVPLNNIDEKIQNIKIYTAESKKVYENTHINSDNLEINLKTKGVHYLFFETENSLFFEKIIVL